MSAGTPSGGMDAIVAMWDGSSGHAPVIRTEGTWAFLNSGSIGCATGTQQSHCWFSQTTPGGTCSASKEVASSNGFGKVAVASSSGFGLLQNAGSSGGATVSYSATFSATVSTSQKNLFASNIDTAAQSSTSNLCSGQSNCSGTQVTQSASISTSDQSTSSEGGGGGCFSTTNSVQSADGLSVLIGDVQVFNLF